MKKIFYVLSLLIITGVILTACGGAAEEKTITVGSKNWNEQYILGWMTLLVLEDAGFTVENRIDTGGTAVCREALVNGEIDVYWEYTGTGWLTHLGHEDAITDPQECYDQVKAEDAENGLVWLDYAPFNNTYTLMMTIEDGEKYGVSTLSDVGDYLAENPDAKMCSDEEWTVRPDGYPALQESYGWAVKEENVLTMEIGVTYKALRDGDCALSMGFATDGRIAAWDFFNLEDDKQFFPVYNPAPVIRQEIMDKYPEIADLLRPIAQALTTEEMIRLNALADVGADHELETGDEQDAKDVACNFLIEKNILESCGD
jgi:osmoprotectant transport system substrate-binding protein